MPSSSKPPGHSVLLPRLEPRHFVARAARATLALRFATDYVAPMPVTQRRDEELPADLRHDADSGPVITPNYAVLNREDWERLIERALDERDFKIAWERRKAGDPEDATLDELIEKYGL